MMINRILKSIFYITTIFWEVTWKLLAAVFLFMMIMWCILIHHVQLFQTVAEAQRLS